MTKAIKKTIVTILLLCVAFAFVCFTACGGSTPDTPNNSGNGQQQEQTENTDKNNGTNGSDESSDNKTVTVTFVANGTKITDKTVSNGDSVTEFPSVPEKAGYIGNWDVTSLNNVTSDITVNAVYTAKTYMLVFNYDGADGNNSQTTKTIAFDAVVGSLPKPTKTGFSFDGWYYGEAEITESTIWKNDISENATLIAKWGIADDGYSVSSSNDFVINDTKMTIKDYIFFDTEYDLRNRFTVSKGAEWRAFTTSDCLQSTEIITRKINLEYGWNIVYIMVENKTTYLQRVYEIKIYKYPVSELGEDGETYYVKKGEDCCDVIIPEEYEGKPITGIGDSAFKDCSLLTNVTIGNAVTSIEKNAFSGCSALESINVDKDNANYSSVDGILYNKSQTEFIHIPKNIKGSVTIPNTITSIKSSAFYNCSSLEGVTIPNSVTSIRDEAFRGCSSLTSIEVAEDNANYKSIDGNLYSKDGTTLIQYAIGKTDTSYIISDGVTSIGNDAFYGCKSLTSVTIGESVTRIGQYSFYNCTALTEIKYNAIECGVSSSSYNYAFANAGKDGTGIKVTIGKKVREIPYNLFDMYKSSCIPKITEVVFEEGSVCNRIKSRAFYNCDSIEKIYYNGDINNWVQIEGLGELMYYGNVSYYGESSVKLFINGELLTKVNITTATKISADAFYNCSSLKSVTVGNSVTSIGYGAFGRCSGLEEITIPFVGAEAGKTSNDYYQYPFGYIFGGRRYTGGNYISQYYFYESTSSTTNGVFYIPSSLKKVTVTGGNILYGAFMNCSWLTSITIGDNVTGIEYKAFYNCSSLIYNEYNNAYYLGNTNNPYLCLIKAKSTDITSCIINEKCKFIYSEAFRNCESIESITIPNSITSIGRYAFYNCSSLESITIPNSVTSVGEMAFSSCESLESVNYTGTIDQWAQISFDVSVGYNSGNSNPLWNKAKLYINNELVTEANITTATKINTCAFYGYKSLTSVTIGESVKSIGRYAFYGCKALTEIKYNATECADLLEFDDVFVLAGAYGTELKVTIGKNVKRIPAYLFNESYITEVVFEGESSFIVFEEGPVCESIGDCAFTDCSLLTSITIPNSVKSIGKYAFSWCSSLESVTFRVTSWWYASKYSDSTYSGTQLTLDDTAQNATYLTDTYCGDYWICRY